MAWLLVQRSLTPPEIELVQRAFQSTGIFHTLDAVSFVKDAFGVLAKGLEDYPAKQLQNALAVQGVEVDVVDESEWPKLPPAKRIVRASCWAEGFEPLDPLGRPLSVPWTEIVAVSAGLVRREEFGNREVGGVQPLSEEAHGFLDVAATTWDLAQGRIESVLVDSLFPDKRETEPLPKPTSLALSREKRQWRWVAEVILAGGLRFVWQAHEFHYAHLGDRVTRDPAANFALFLCDLLSAVPHAALNRGAFALRENQPETAPRYPTRNAFAEETQWLLWRLRRAGRYAPAADA